MKVALTIDSILERNLSVEVLEAFLEIFEEADIFTFAHKQKAVIGPVEMRTIHSSYLTRFVETDDDLWKYSLLVPGAGKNVVIPCSYDLVINISSGRSHGFSVCEDTLQVTYLVEDSISERTPKTLREKFARSFFESWSEKQLVKSNFVWASHEGFNKKDISIDVLPPLFKLSDYPLFPEAHRKLFKYETYLINLETLNKFKVRSIVEFFTKRKEKFKFIGKDDHLTELKSEIGEELFLGNRCAGEMATILASCRALIDFQTKGFPRWSLSTLATGRPVLFKRGSSLRHYLKEEEEGIYTFSGILEDLSEQLLDLNEQELKPEHLRKQAMKYHDVKFKAEVKRRLNKILKMDEF